LVYKSSFLISVIIPVFNAEKFIVKAIESVLIQNEVNELIIIDDGSMDNSLKYCVEYSKKYLRIKILQHPDKKNHGRSASRNLGILNASNNFIAFLDADDFYLPNRFANDIKVFKTVYTADGVYNAISAHFYRNYDDEEFKRLQLTTVREKISPMDLFKEMSPIGNKGYFSGIGLTVKRDVFDKVGLFNEKLEVAEDTEMWIKMSILCNLHTGIIDKAVSLRGVHDNNVSFRDENIYNENYLKMYISLLDWSLKNKLPSFIIKIFWQGVWNYKFITNTSFKEDFKFWIYYTSKYLVVFKFKRTFKSMPLINRLVRLYRNSIK
jgi:glycosyltransferase involved in cell wall biosynthesis